MAQLAKKVLIRKKAAGQMAQPIRIPVTLFNRLDANVDPATPLIAPYMTGDAPKRECSKPIPCYGLVDKTLEVFGQAADLVANPYIIQGTIHAEGTGNPEWFDLPVPGNTLTVSGPIPILIAHPALPTLFVEPELTWLRIVGTGMSGNNAILLPRTLKARFAGLWLGETTWHKRIRDDFGI